MDFGLVIVQFPKQKALENKRYLMLPTEKRPFIAGDRKLSLSKKKQEKMIIDVKNTYWAGIENKLQGTL